MLLSVLEEAQTCHLRQRWATHEGPEHDDGILVNITSPNCSMFNLLKPYLILIFFVSATPGSTSPLTISTTNTFRRAHSFSK